MDIHKKIVIYSVVTIVLFSSFSGCILNEIFGTSFTLSSHSVSDDEGFAGLSLKFSTSGTGTAKIYGPGNTLIDSDPFYYGEQTVVLHLADYSKTVIPGSYYLRAYDENGGKIFEETFSFAGSDLSIESCSPKWWKRVVWKESYSLVGLTLSVSNSGDTPIYPHTLEVTVDSETVSGFVLPVAVLPGENNDVECFIYKEDVENNALTVSLKDSDGVTLDTASFSPPMTHNVVSKDFDWNYGGRSRHLSIPDVDFLLDYYSNLDRFYDDDYAVYVFDSYDDDYLDLLVDNLMYSFGKDSNVDKINFAASFVQNLEYKKDSDTNESVEYARYPIETLFNGVGVGDCEDLSILMASILNELDYDIALFRLPNHMAVGVQLSENALPKYEYYTENYYFLETTSVTPSCGYIPSSSASPSELDVYPISSRPWLSHSWKNGNLAIFYIGGNADLVKSTIVVENLGTGIAKDILVKGAFYTKYEQELNAVTDSISLLEPGMKTEVTFMCNVPHSSTTSYKTKIYLDNELIDEHTSESSFS